MRNAPTLLATLALALTVTACASGARPMPAPTPTLLPPPPAWLLVRCPTLPQPDRSDGVSLLQNHAEVTLRYRRCLDRHAALSAWIKTVTGLRHE